MPRAVITRFLGGNERINPESDRLPPTLYGTHGMPFLTKDIYNPTEQRQSGDKVLRLGVRSLVTRRQPFSYKSTVFLAIALYLDSCYSF